MSVCGCTQKSDSVLIRQAFKDYSGAYVIHCHFLGHEDRGMMWNVQTVCPANSGIGEKFGKLDLLGGPDDCRELSTFMPNPLPNMTLKSGY